MTVAARATAWATGALLEVAGCDESDELVWHHSDLGPLLALGLGDFTLSPQSAALVAAALYARVVR